MNLLEEQSLAKILSLTAFRLESCANKHLFEPSGLTMATARIMHIIKAHGPQTPTQILRFLGGTKSNLTQRLNLLEKHGLVQRSTATEDKRSVLIRLTDQGKKRYEEVWKRMTEKAWMLDKQFTKDERAQCITVLKKLNAMLDSQLPHCPHV